ncbi:hypothetical protein [Vacuolonema iberomarrocanum]|uniref:hypothetical protein n=1 Tax=Vacuolonema iberomarrocanum TaxID=3454632 RepID=UPI0019F59313|nr:hypothetical protein [filamentous cyanobacterium LEGE 07170]
MREGDLVRLKQPIRPALSNAKFYLYGIVIKIMATDPEAIAQAADTEVLVQLYDPQANEVYVDELGTQAIYCFRKDELETG